MFYCDACAERKEWPKTALFKSRGRCEMCSDVGICNDVPSRVLGDIEDERDLEAAIKSILDAQSEQ